MVIQLQEKLKLQTKTHFVFQRFLCDSFMSSMFRNHEVILNANWTVIRPKLVVRVQNCLVNNRTLPVWGNYFAVLQ